MSPEEMNLDPELSFRNDLPDVTNVHNAKMTVDCGLAGTNNDAHITILIEETGQVLEFGAARGDRTLLDGMPAAARVEQLAEGRVVQDNAAEIADLLERHNELSPAGCGCGFGRARSVSSAGILIGLLIVLGAARRKKVSS
jgi:hypothetical protein